MVHFQNKLFPWINGNKINYTETSCIGRDFEKKRQVSFQKKKTKLLYWKSYYTVHGNPGEWSGEISFPMLMHQGYLQKNHSAPLQHTAVQPSD